MERRDLNRMDHLTWTEFQERMNHAVVMLPLGAVEQHGYHLPLGVDTQLPFQLALATAKRFPAIVAPSLWYGYRSQPRSGGGGTFPGTTSFDGNTVASCVRDLVGDFARQGQRFVAVLNGHMENTSFAGEGIDLALRERPAGDVKVVLINWWEHASLTETSLMAHFLPTLVLQDRLGEQEEYRPVPSYSIWPEPRGLVPESWVLYQARGASAEKGEVLAEHLVERMAEILRKEFPTLVADD